MIAAEVDVFELPETFTLFNVGNLFPDKNIQRFLQA